jgi:hypothetical protein
MKYVVEVGLVAVICIPSFVKSGSLIQKLLGGEHTEDGYCISLFC